VERAVTSKRLAGRARHARLDLVAEKEAGSGLPYLREAIAREDNR
jgi:hypothetical protein